MLTASINKHLYHVADPRRRCQQPCSQNAAAAEEASQLGQLQPTQGCMVTCVDGSHIYADMPRHRCAHHLCLTEIHTELCSVWQPELLQQSNNSRNPFQLAFRPRSAQAQGRNCTMTLYVNLLARRGCMCNKTGISCRRLAQRRMLGMTAHKFQEWHAQWAPSRLN